MVSGEFWSLAADHATQYFKCFDQFFAEYMNVCRCTVIQIYGNIQCGVNFNQRSPGNFKEALSLLQ